MKTAKELFSLDNRVAIVTGGRGLYGASISAGLCEMGAQVVIASRSGENVKHMPQSSARLDTLRWVCRST